MVENASATLSFEAGEYRIYTDVKLPKPEIGLSIEEISTDESVFSTIYPNPTNGVVNILVEIDTPSGCSGQYLQSNRAGYLDNPITKVVNRTAHY
ncbi:MAG: hypothetical protein R2764_02735 [Bacteroidales bacterium]